MKHSKPKPAAGGRPRIDIAIPVFGDKPHISIDRGHGIVRRAKVTDAAAHDGARLRGGLIDPNETASDVRADSASRSAWNERFLAGTGKVRRIHRRKPKGRPMPRRTARADAAKWGVRAFVEPPLRASEGADQPGDADRRTGARAAAGAFANMACNRKRRCWLARRTLPARRPERADQRRPSSKAMPGTLPQRARQPDRAEDLEAAPTPR